MKSEERESVAVDERYRSLPSSVCLNINMRCLGQFFFYFVFRITVLGLNEINPQAHMNIYVYWIKEVTPFFHFFSLSLHHFFILKNILSLIFNIFPLPFIMY